MGRPRSELGPYFAVRASYWRDELIDKLSLEASGLWVRVNSMCADHKNDGRFHRSMLHAIFRGKPVDLGIVAELCDLGWWREDGEHIVVINYTKHNPSAKELEESAASARNRKAEYRARASDASSGTCEPDDGNVPRDNSDIVPRDNALRIRIRQRQDKDTEARARETGPEPENVEPSKLRGFVLRFFAESYERKRGDAWMQASYFTRDFDRMAKMCKSELDAKIAIENYFANADAYAQAEDYSPVILAKNWNKYRNPPKPKPATAPRDSRWDPANKLAWSFDPNNPPPSQNTDAYVWWCEQNNQRIREAG